jgi:hypothetical protein
MMWFRLKAGITALSAGLQQFVGDSQGYFEAPDHLERDIVGSGGAVAVGPHHPERPPEPTISEGPEAVPIALVGEGPVNLPGEDHQAERRVPRAVPPSDPEAA